MGALQEVVTQMTPPPQADSGSPGQPVTPVPSTAGDFGPRLSEEGQKESSTQRSTVEELGATPAVCALKCLPRVVFGQGLPLCL